MNNACVIKSSKDGLILVLNSDLEFPDLKDAVREKFEQNKNFFGKGEMTIGFSGRKTSPIEEAELIDEIEKVTDLSFKYIVENDEISDIRMLGMMDRFYFDKIMTNAKIYAGSVTKETEVFSDSSLIIIGDVKSKARVKARGNIIILGELLGEAYAGFESDNEACYIIANSFNPSLIRIGNVEGPVETHDSFFNRFKKNHDDSAIVGIYDGKLTMEPLRAGLLKELSKENEE